MISVTNLKACFAHVWLTWLPALRTKEKQLAKFIPKHFSVLQYCPNFRIITFLLVDSFYNYLAIWSDFHSFPSFQLCFNQCIPNCTCFFHHWWTASLLSAFPEDYEICFRRLIRLWVAEGFIQCTEGKSLKHVAEDCLKNLIDRSLTMVSKKRLMEELRHAMSMICGEIYASVKLKKTNSCCQILGMNHILLPHLLGPFSSTTSTATVLFLWLATSQIANTCIPSIHYVPARWVFSEQLMSFKYSPPAVQLQKPPAQFLNK